MVRVPKARTAIVVATVAVVAGTAGPSTLPTGGTSPLAPVARAAVGEGAVTRAVRRLQASQRSDGGFGTRPGAASSDPTTTVWAALALASVGVHPADQPGKGTTLQQYLDKHAKDLKATGDLARLALVLDAAGRRDSTAGRATMDRLRERQSPDGGFPAGSGGSSRVEPTAFALVALSRGNLPLEAVAQSRGTTWLRSAAAPAGGWGPAAGAKPQPGPTALALQALQAPRVLAEKDDIALGTGAQSLLTNSIAPNGALSDGGAADPVVTAWAMQAFRAAGIKPKTVAGIDGGTVESYLTDAQQADGGFGSTLRTAQVLPGFNGTAFPLRATRRSSALASDRAPGAPRKNAAAGPADDADDDAGALDDAQVGGTDDGAPTASGDGAGTDATAGSSSTSAPSSTGGGALPDPVDGAADAPAAAAPTPAAAEPGPSPKDAASPKSAEDPKDAPAKDDPVGDAVSGLVVGAQAAAATTPGGVAAGGGGGEDRGPAIALGVALLVAAALGTQLERRRARGPFS